MKKKPKVGTRLELQSMLYRSIVEIRNLEALEKFHEAAIALCAAKLPGRSGYPKLYRTNKQSKWKILRTPEDERNARL